MSDAAAVVRDVGVVIVAGGSGTRTGSKELKQFRWVAGKPVLLHSLQTFMARPDIVSVVVVLPIAYAADPPPWVFQCDVDRLMISTGGKTRTESVSNGIDDLPDEAEIVLIHDAARPLVGDATIDRVIAAVRSGTPAIAALPVVDTLKETSSDAPGRIARTIDRRGLWRAQTPQGFSRDLIVRVHRQARTEHVDATDDAARCEYFGHDVSLVPGSERALKITQESDFGLVDALFPLPE
jgi:2-C-methyl-D-erythritol 4-phosphate cytidylyltransferase